MSSAPPAATSQRGERDGVRREAAPAEDADETRSAREAGGVDEDGKAEHPDRLRQRELRVERAERDAGEEDGRNPEREPAHPYLRPEHADRGDDEEQQNGVVLEDVHALSVVAASRRRIGVRPQRGFG